MWSNPQFPEDLVLFTEEILKGKLFFVSSVRGVFENFSLSMFDRVLNAPARRVSKYGIANFDVIKNPIKKVCTWLVYADMPAMKKLLLW